MRRNPGILHVARSGVLAVCRSAHKSLAVVGRRIQKMADDLLSRPPAIAPRQVRDPRRDRNEGPMNLIQISAKSLRQSLRHSVRTPCVSWLDYFFNSARAARTSSE